MSGATAIGRATTGATLRRGAATAVLSAWARQEGLVTVAVGATGAGSETMVMDAATQEEIERLDGAVDAFAAEMKARLREQALKGYRGWDDPAQYECIVAMLREHA